jgi:cytoskeletal protein CcmA (bactofilin family)
MLFANKQKDAAASTTGSTTIIGSGVVLTGDITSTADIRIDGTVKGNVSSSSRVLLGAEGTVEGNINCKQADVMGTIRGNVRTSDILSLRGSANLQGDISASKLQVEPTANFNGRCNMSNTNVVEMQTETNEQPKAFVAK